MVEKIFTVVLGGTIGVVFGVLIKSYCFEYITQNIEYIFIISMCVVGMLLSFILMLYENQTQSRKDNELRNDAVALITHELRTALTSSGWLIESMLNKHNDHMDESEKKMMNDLVKSNQTTVMHTVNLLDVSLSEIGKLLISLKKTDLKEVNMMLEEVVEKFALGTKREGIKLTTEIKLDPDKQVEVDMLRLRIIVENLLENSIQYTKTQNGEIKLKVDNTQTTLDIEVSDNGIGIPENEQSKVFAEFYRASNARKILNSGSGIGLSMTQKYVKAHNGTIRFHSKEGMGTTFYISIPLKTSADVKEFLTKL